MIAPAHTPKERSRRLFCGCGDNRIKTNSQAWRDFCFYYEVEIRALLLLAGTEIDPKPLIDWEELEFHDTVSSLLRDRSRE